MKKGQEELVGFVMIVIIVAVVLLVLLSIGLRRSAPEPVDSVELNHFLQSSMVVTSDCSLLSAIDRAQMSELLRACVDGRTCFDGTSTCEAVLEGFSELLDAGWQVGPDRPYTAYTFESSYFPSGGGAPEQLVMLTAGDNCTGSTRGGSHISPARFGTIATTFEVCIV